MPTFLGGKRSGSGRVRSRKGNLIYEHDWEATVRADDKYQEDYEILATPGVKRVNRDMHGNAICKTCEATRDAVNATLWHIKASFSSEVEEGTSPSDPNKPDDPALWIPVRETIFEKKPKPLREDKVTGLPIVNSAGLPFDGVIHVDHIIIVWEFWQFEFLTDVTINNFAYEGVTDEILSERNEKVNEGVFKGKEPKTLLLTVGKSTVGFFYGFRRRLTQYFLKYDPDTWTEKIPDVSTHEFVGGVLVPIFDDDGNLILKGLDGAGEKVADGDPPAILERNKYAVSEFEFLHI